MAEDLNMTELILAFTLFLALHSIPARPAVRGKLISLLGRNTYIALYSLASVAALAWLFHAALNTDYVELWSPAPWQAWITLVFAPIGIFLVLAGLLSPNPYSISFRRASEPEGAIVAVTRHPVLWGFLLWSLSHLAPNGDLGSLFLFGGFAAFSMGGFVMLERRAKKRMGAGWAEHSQRSSVIPFAAVLSGNVQLRKDFPMIAALLACIVTVAWLLAGGHMQLFAADPLVRALPGF
jgi:uncharacterized membrane protein